MRSLAAASAVVVAWFLTPITGAQAPPDPDAAERQYRLAQRLGAEGSADAPAAFEKAVALAPRGPYADDALVDLARLNGAPDWPEDLGALTATNASSARARLETVVAANRDGDRIPEARYRLALLRLAPLPGRDAARARQELIALADNPSPDPWARKARYALGVLDERAGARERAAGAFARIVIEWPESEVAPRARAGFGRTLLAEERFGDAAGWFQAAIAGGAPPTIGAAAQRELALRELMRARLPARRFTSVSSPLASTPTTRGASLLAAASDGRLVVADRKAGLVQGFDAAGRASTLGSAEDVTALATDAFGRVFAVTKEKLIRWDATGAVASASLGAFASATAIAVDASGTVWIADRKGDRIARWADGAAAPVVVRESKGAGVTALAVSGGRVIAAEEKTGRLIAVSENGAESVFGSTTFRRPIALAIDAAARVSVLDEKAGTVTRLAPGGEVRETLSLVAAGVSRPLALAAGADGSVLILDGATGAVAVAP